MSQINFGILTTGATVVNLSKFWEHEQFSFGQTGDKTFGDFIFLAGSKFFQLKFFI